MDESIIPYVLLVLVAGGLLALLGLRGLRGWPRAGRPVLAADPAPVAAARPERAAGQPRWMPLRRPRLAIRRVDPLVLAPPDRAFPEPPLLNAVIDCATQTSLLHGRRAGRGGVATLTVRAASLRGIGHAVAGKTGQDAAAVRWHAPSHTLYVAVADGLGSLPDSGAAARTAVEAAVTHVVCGTSAAGTDRGAVLFGRVARTIEAVVGGDGPDNRGNGATTLAVAEVRPVASGALISVWGVGDSEAWLLGPKGWDALHHERDGARENVTRQLPRHPRPSTNQVRAPRGSVLLLATDGFAGSIAARSRLGRTLGELWRTVPSPLGFAAHVDFVDAYCTDDRTAVAIWIGGA